MKVVFMGTPDIAAKTLEALLQSEHEVAVVVTQPDKPNSRGKEIIYSPVKQVAVDSNIPVLQPIKASSEEFIAELGTYNADAIIVAAYGQILKSAVLKMTRYGCINVHASLLPGYRGSSPIQWCVINGERETGITIMRMDEGIDTGDIIFAEKLTLKEDETAGSLHDRLAEMAGPVLLRALKQLEEGTATFTKQDEAQASYVSMLSKSMGELSFDQPAEVLERRIRGLIPWPGAYTYLNKKVLKLWKTSVIRDDGRQYADMSDGTVINTDNKRILVKTSDGLLEINELQLEGKRKMATEEFLRGYHVENGMILGERK